VKRLLMAGADPNIKLESGETPVMIAARSGKADVVELLLAKGADPNGHGTRGQTALMWAVAEHHPDVVKSLLVHHGDLNARSEVWTQLWQTSLDQDVHPDYQAQIKMGGDTAILFAARSGDLDSAKLLVEYGANVNDASAYGTSATVLAAYSGNAELVDFLLSHKADPNAAQAGYTALHAAILHGNTQVVAALLEHGADANAKLRASTPTRRSSADYFFHPAFIGATPFWLAARYSEPDIMKLLVAHGADPLFVQNVDFWGTRTKTSDYKHEAPGPTTALMAALGLGRGAGFRPVPVAEREQRTFEAVKIAVEAGVPVNAADSEGRTALEAATAMDYKSVMSYLTEKGATLKGPVRPMKKEVVDN
jgi:ankyrin repeat protein